MTPTTTPMAESREDARPVGDPRGFIHPEEVALRIEAAAESREDGGVGLLDAARVMVELVEGVSGAIEHGTFRDKHGRRLKDTAAWMGLYVAFKQAERAPDLSVERGSILSAMVDAALASAHEDWPEGIQYILMRGLTAMGCELPRLASESLMEEALIAAVNEAAAAPASDAAAVVDAARAYRKAEQRAWNGDRTYQGEIGEARKALDEALALSAPPAASAGHGGERVGGDGLGLEEVERLAIECEDEALKWEADAREGQSSAISYCEWFGDLAHTLRALAVRACLVQAPPAEEAPWTQAEWDASEAESQAFIDRAWETYKAALPVAKVINDNQPGWTFIAETAQNVTLMVGTELYLHPVPSGAPPDEPAPAMGVQEAAQVLAAFARRADDNPSDPRWAEATRLMEVRGDGGSSWWDVMEGGLSALTDAALSTGSPA